jgi:multiple antibiotic resistance protein
MSYIEAIIVLFAIVDPIGNIPIFLSLTDYLGPEDTRKAFNVSVIVGAVILLVFAFAGQTILSKVFNIQVNDIMIAGGVLLFILATDHLFGGKFERITALKSETRPYEIGSVPLGCPLLAGPGAMVTSLTIIQKSGPVHVVVAIAVVFVATWIMLQFVGPLQKAMGKLISQVFSKVLALFIAAIGVNMVLRGISEYIKTLNV